MNLMSPFRMCFAVGVLATGVFGSGAGAQTQYPLIPPVVVLTAPTPPAPSALPAAAAVPTTTAAPKGEQVAAAPAVVGKLPSAEVLSETIEKTATPAFTGSSATKPLVGAGVAFVLAGTFFVVVTRRRRTAGARLR